MSMSDREKIAIAREHFVRADQGRPDVLELFHEDAEIYFRKFGFGLGRQSFVDLVKGFEGSLESIRHDYERLTFAPSGDPRRRRNVSGQDVRQILGERPDPRGTLLQRPRVPGRAERQYPHSHLDPDNTGDNVARFRWGKNRAGKAIAAKLATTRDMEAI